MCGKVIKRRLKLEGASDLRIEFHFRVIWRRPRDGYGSRFNVSIIVSTRDRPIIQILTGQAQGRESHLLL